MSGMLMDAAFNEVTHNIIGAAIKMHRHLGPRLARVDVPAVSPVRAICSKHPIRNAAVGSDPLQAGDACGDVPDRSDRGGADRRGTEISGSTLIHPRRAAPDLPSTDQLRPRRARPAYRRAPLRAVARCRCAARSSSHPRRPYIFCSVPSAPSVCHDLVTSLPVTILA